MHKFFYLRNLFSQKNQKKIMTYVVTCGACGWEMTYVGTWDNAEDFICPDCGDTSCSRQQLAVHTPPRPSDPVARQLQSPPPLRRQSSMVIPSTPEQDTINFAQHCRRICTRLIDQSKISPLPPNWRHVVRGELTELRASSSRFLHNLEEYEMEADSDTESESLGSCVSESDCDSEASCSSTVLMDSSTQQLH